MPSTPSRLSATTRNPDTAPPRSETLMASLTLRWAAAAVRRFAWTAMNMPMKPASPEQNAPTRKAMAVLRPCSTSFASTPINPPMMMAASTAKIAIVRYCRFKKAIAPSKMRPATSCIALVPRSCESTSRASHKAKTIAMNPASRTTHHKCIGTQFLPLASRQVRFHSGGQNLRDGRRRAERGSWRKTTHGDASHAATRFYTSALDYDVRGRPPMTSNAFAGARASLQTARGDMTYFRLRSLVELGHSQVERLPMTVKVLLENLLRN